MKKVTIKDVARYAGVTPATVSYVINGRNEKVSSDTISRVNKVIEDINYIPNYAARGLVKDVSKLLGVFIYQMKDIKQAILLNPFYSEVISGIELSARERGYHIIVSGIDNDKSYIDLCVQRNLDGVILMGIFDDDNNKDIKKINKPIVLIDSYIEDDFFYKVGIDDEFGGYLATKYLIEKGHRNVAIVLGGVRKDGVSEKRFLGYKRALEESNIRLNQDFIFENDVSYEYGFEAGEVIANNFPDITAIFAAADIIATGLINSLVDCGKQIPNDISIIGFDDVYMSSKLHIPLTTINQNIILKGEKAVEVLINAIEGNYENISKNILLPIKVVERKTVRELK